MYCSQVRSWQADSAQKSPRTEAVRRVRASKARSLELSADRAGAVMVYRLYLAVVYAAEARIV
jgi:hypothetical protein